MNGEVERSDGYSSERSHFIGQHRTSLGNFLALRQQKIDQLSNKNDKGTFREEVGDIHRTCQENDSHNIKS